MRHYTVQNFESQLYMKMIQSTKLTFGSFLAKKLLLNLEKGDSMEVLGF